MTGFIHRPQRAARLIESRDGAVTRRYVAACVRAMAVFVGAWILFGSSPAWASDSISQLPPPAPMCGADGTTVEAPPTLRSASGDELNAPCSEDLMRLVGAKGDRPPQDALWIAQAQVDHAVLLLGDAQVLPLPELLTFQPAPALAPVEHPLRIYRPPRG
ncbi:MAG: hypothetical protein KC766_31595 [Myxococcales bacterium]|nr:hypothetical protein [Myxococcales bacterium]